MSADALPGRKTPLGGSGSVNQWRLTRKDLLRGSIGAAVLLMGPRYLRDALTADTASAAVSSNYFVFGTPDPSNNDIPSLTAGGSSGGSTTIVQQGLVSPPVRSADRTRLATVAIADLGGTPGVVVDVIDTTTGAVTASGTLPLEAGNRALVLVNPALSPGAKTVCLAIAITTPSSWKQITKLNPLTGNSETREAATWVSSHAVAYFDVASSTFAGPFMLNNAPALANVNVAATATDFCLWTIAEPAAVMGTKDKPLPQPIPTLSVFPIGSSKPRLSVPAPATWPVNGEPTAPLGNGDFVRLVNGTTLEVYSSVTGASASVPFASLALTGTARPTRTRMQQLPDGALFISNPGLGQAIVLDGNKPSSIRASISHPPRSALAGSHMAQAQASDDASSVFALGPLGGISRYDAASGRLTATSAHDSQFTGFFRIESGELVATSLTSPKLTFFDDGLNKIGTADTSYYVEGVF